MELRHLRTFLIVAETQNISEAARRLRVTQPALGRHIRDLEHTIGTPLFVREPGRFRLTPAGRTLRDRGPAALAAIEQALHRARGVAAERSATVRVG
jgi:DNA-binding transcriptional LysR family regulator